MTVLRPQLDLALGPDAHAADPVRRLREPMGKAWDVAGTAYSSRWPSRRS